MLSFFQFLMNNTPNIRLISLLEKITISLLCPTHFISAIFAKKIFTQQTSYENMDGANLTVPLLTIKITYFLSCLYVVYLFLFISFFFQRKLSTRNGMKANDLGSWNAIRYSWVKPTHHYSIKEYSDLLTEILLYILPLLKCIFRINSYWTEKRRNIFLAG